MPSSDLYDFDLPRLPLAQALTRYSDLTRLSVLYETRLIADKTSAVLQGRYTPQAALKQLLAGTGLDPRFVNRRSATLTALPVAVAAGSGLAATRRYDGQLQTRIAQALCAQPAIEAGRYRIVLRFWVNDEQRIDPLRVRVAQRPELEPAVHAALAGMPVGAPPPGAAQPTVVIISPETAHGGRACGP